MILWKWYLITWFNRLAYLLGAVSRHQYYFRCQQNRQSFNRLNAAKYWEKHDKLEKAHKVIYTCICGDYDEIAHHEYLNPIYDYICFTDKVAWLEQKKVGAWQMKPLCFIKNNSQQTNRYHKMMPHLLFPEADDSVYVDGNVNLRSAKVFEMLANVSSAGTLLAGHRHFARNCLYQEAETIINLKKDKAETVSEQLELMRADGFPKNFGLHECNVLYRRHHDKNVVKTMEDWWFWVSSHSRRDQLSFEYVCWKNSLPVKDLTACSLRQFPQYFKLEKHMGEQLKSPYPEKETKVCLSWVVTPKRLKINFWGIPFSLKGDFRRKGTSLHRARKAEIEYWDKTGEVINLKNPQTLTDKINWLQIFEPQPEALPAIKQTDREVVVYCSQGEILLVAVFADLQNDLPEQAVYDAQMKRIPVKLVTTSDNFVTLEQEILTKKQFAVMIAIAAEKSREYKFATVHFAERADEFIFNKIDFVPYDGFLKFLPVERDLELGLKIKI